MKTKIHVGLCAVLELVPPGGEKHFKPRPQNRILVHLKGSFQNLRRAAPSQGARLQQQQQ